MYTRTIGALERFFRMNVPPTVYAVVAVVVVVVQIVGFPDYTQSGVIARVIDADTFDVATGQREIRVRLAKIDAPEIDTDWGRAASRTVEGLVGTRVALVCESELGKYGRHICEVHVGNVDVGLELAKRGLARCFYLTAADFAYRRACAVARRDKIGMYKSG